MRGHDQVILAKGNIEAGIEGTLSNVPDLATSLKIILDLSGIGGINSLGTIEWSRGLAKILTTFEVELWNCPVAFVDYCNFFPNITGPLNAPRRANVVSFEVPYFCESCNFQQCEIFTAERARVDRRMPKVACRKCSQGLEPEVNSEDYLSFLFRTGG